MPQHVLGFGDTASIFKGLNDIFPFITEEEWVKNENE